MEWEKIFANYVTDEGLISKNTNSLYSLIFKKKKTKTKTTQQKNDQKTSINIYPKKTYRWLSST